MARLKYGPVSIICIDSTGCRVSIGAAEFMADVCSSYKSGRWDKVVIEKMPYFYKRVMDEFVNLQHCDVIIKNLVLYCVESYEVSGMSYRRAADIFAEMLRIATMFHRCSVVDAVDVVKTMHDRVDTTGERVDLIIYPEDEWLYGSSLHKYIDSHGMIENGEQNDIDCDNSVAGQFMYEYFDITGRILGEGLIGCNMIDFAILNEWGEG